MDPLQPRQTDHVSRHGMIVAGFITCAMVLGGGGSPSPATEVALQLAFAVAFLLWVWWAPRHPHSLSKTPRPIFWFGVLLLSLPLIQSIPMPPAIWQALPSRELQLAALELIGAGDSWQSLSISPAKTLAAFLALVPAVGLMWLTSVLPTRDRRLVLQTIALMALLGAALGALQMASGPDAFRLYEKTHRGWLVGFHANRNAAADVLLVGMLAVSALHKLLRPEPTRLLARTSLVIAAQAVLGIAVILTGSRAGIAILILTLPLHWLILRKQDGRLDMKWMLPAAGVGALILALLPSAISSNARLYRVAQRFDVTGDARLPLWQDVMNTLEGFWPAGSGLGTFSKAIQPFENVQHLGEFFPNRAHNDYLEFFIEAGIVAPAILILGAVIMFRQARRAWKLSPRDHALQVFAMGVIAIVALHSMVDYPLRNMAIACLAGVAAGLLTVTPRPSMPNARQEGRESTR